MKKPVDYNLWVNWVKGCGSTLLISFVNFVVLILFLWLTGTVCVWLNNHQVTQEVSNASKSDVKLWHCRLGHIKKQYVKTLSTFVAGDNLNKSSWLNFFCDIFDEKKSVSLLDVRSLREILRIWNLELVWWDVKDPGGTTSSNVYHML